jgi:hypothetical protein
MKDLIVSVADSYQEKVMEALLPRIPVSSGTRQFSYDIVRNIGNDSGSYYDSHELLRPYINDYRFAIVVFDLEGSGVENNKTREQAEIDVEHLLSINGWNKKNMVIVIKPEIETWMWVDNPNVEIAIGWDKQESLYSWARSNGLIVSNESKPSRPKESLEKALRNSDTAKSSAIYKKIATTVSYRNCKDPAFIKLIAILSGWFPPNK